MGSQAFVTSLTPTALALSGLSSLLSGSGRSLVTCRCAVSTASVWQTHSLESH